MKKEYIKKNLIGSLHRKGFMFVLFCLVGAGFCFSQNYLRDTDPGVCTYTTVGPEFGGGYYALTGATTGGGPSTGPVLFKLGVTTVNQDFTVTVIDIEPPYINCLPDQTESCSGVYIVPGTVFDPNFSDNCLANIAYTLTGATTGVGISLDGHQFNIGVTTVTWKATDASGNTAYCIYIVDVGSKKNLTNICPANLIVDNDPGECGAVVTFNTPVGTDNCTHAVTIQIAGLSSGAFYPPGNTINTFSTTDYYGNITTCSFMVTVNDTELPKFTNCPANKTVNNAAGLCGATVTYTNVVATDNCPGVATVLVSGAPGGSIFPVGSTINCYIATDASGNIASCCFTVTVIDNALPKILCPANMILNNDPGACGATVNYSYPSYSDNCQGVTISQMQGFASGSVFPVGITTNTFVVTDASGNSAYCSCTVKVNDNTPPFISCPSNQIRNSGHGVCTYPTLGTEFNPLYYGDNCMGATLSYKLAGVTSTSGVYINSNNLSGTILNKGITTITWKVTDATGKTAICSFTVTVIDNELPVINCPSDQQKYANTSGCKYTNAGTAFDPTFSDNCPTSGVWPKTSYFLTGATTTLNWTNPSPTTTLNAKIFFNGTTIVTWKVSDQVGNNASCSFTVLVYPPQAIIITPSSPSIGSGGSVQLTATSVPPNYYTYNYTWTPTASLIPVTGIGATVTAKPTVTTTYKVTGKDNHLYGCNNTATVLVTVIKSQAAIDEEAIVINEKGVVLKNFPNPFSQMTTVVFSVPEDTYVKLDVYGMTGRLVNNLFAGDAVNNKDYTVEFDCNACPNGIYLYRITTDKAVYTGKMILLK